MLKLCNQGHRVRPHRVTAWQVSQMEIFAIGFINSSRYPRNRVSDRRASTSSSEALHRAHGSVNRRVSVPSGSSNELPGSVVRSNERRTRVTPQIESLTNEPPWNTQEMLPRPFTAYSTDRPSGMLYAQIAEQGVSQTRPPIVDSDRTMFLGEAFSLTYVVHDVLAPFLSASSHYQKRLHFPLTESTHGPSLNGRAQGGNYLHEQSELLRERGLLFLPSSSVIDQLLGVYFQWFHPAFPLIDRASLLADIKDHRQSLLVLSSILMIAVTFCDTRLLQLTGFKDRLTARKKFFLQSRAIYDADLETDKIKIIGSVFLMSFWWDRPDEVKDSWHWIGIAIGMAQSMGMHRS